MKIQYSLHWFFKCKTQILILIIFLLYSGGALAQTAVIDSWSKPSIYTLSPDYSLTANGQNVDIIRSEDSYDYAHFSMGTGTCNFVVTVKNISSISNLSIAPSKLNIAYTVTGNVVTFSIPNDEYVILWIKEKSRKLVIAADPLETAIPASSGVGIYNVTASPFNADATGATLTTTAMQNAVDQASVYGTANATKGIVYVPAGVYKMGNLKLKSNVALYLEKGSVLRVSDNAADYITYYKKNSLNMNGTWFVSTEFNSSNILIYGRGTIDGNGVYMQKTLKYLNHVLVPIACSNFTFDGPVIRNSACWGVVVGRSSNVTFKNYKHFNSMSIAEDDGIDVNESQNVLIQHAIGIAHDDPFSTKTWAGVELFEKWPGNPQLNYNVTFDDCFSWTGCVGFKVGQGMNERQENITFKNGVIYDCARGLAIEHKWGANEAKNITFENIDIEKIGNSCEGPQWLQLFVKSGDGLGGGPVNNVLIKNIRVRDKGSRVSQLRGHSEASAIRGVTFENIYMLDNERPAATLEEMNVTEVNEFISDVTILPKQEAPTRIQIEYYNAATNTSLGANPEGVSGRNANFKNGTVLAFNKVDFGAGTSSIDVRLATANSGGSLEFRLDSETGTLIGTLAVTPTVDWETYKTISASLTNASGVHTLYIVGKKSDGLTVANVNWFELVGRKSVYATTYSECNYTGNATALATGDYTQADLAGKGITDNTISSMRVATGMLAIGSDGSNFENPSINIDKDSACLASSGMNDKISSLKIGINSPTNLDNTVWHLKNRHSGLFMNASNVTTDGVTIDQATSANQSNQEFKFVHKGNGVYSIVTGGNTGTKVLEVSQDSIINGTRLIQNPYVEAKASQLFYLRPTGDGYYSIVAKHSNKLIEVKNISTVAGATLHQWTEGSQPWGQWQFVGSNEMDIAQESNNIPASGTFDFGTFDLGSSSTDVEFTISNTGYQTLTLTGTPKIILSGTHSSDFTIIGDPVSPIASGASSTFKIKFTPSALGIRTAQISIASDDADENPYIINLKGQGGKLSQTLTYDFLPGKVFGDAPFTAPVSTTSTSGIPITLSSSNTAVATVSGTTITIVGVGRAFITANLAGNATYEAAASITRTLVIHKGPQTITFGALASKTFGDAQFTLTGSSTSGLGITYTSSNTAVAAISGSTVTITGAGTTTITASQAGNTNYLAATSVLQTLTVNKASQTITFGALANKTYGNAPFALTATTTSGLGITYTSSNTSVATIAGTTVTIVGVGTATITASQAGNANYTAATDVQQSLTVDKAPQTITFGALSAKTYGDASFTLTATVSSPLGITYASSNTTVATISGNTVTIVGVGTTTITASQAGNANYVSATDVPQLLTVNKASQSITFNDLSDKNFNDPSFTIHATATSSLAVAFSIVSGPATLSGNTVTLDGTLGTVTIKASQAGDGNYEAAADVLKSFTVICQTNTPQVTSASNCGSGAVTLSASGSTNGNYKWYTTSSGNTAIAGEVNSTYTTPTLLQSTTYFVTTTNILCESERVPVEAEIKAFPAVPVLSQEEGSLSIILVSSSNTGNQWFRNGNSIPGATGQTLELKESGSFSVTVTTNGCSTSSLETVITDTENSLNTMVETYPVPAKHKIIVKGIAGKKGEARLYDVTGKIRSITPLNDSQVELDLTGLDAGFYTIEIISGKEKITKKITKTKD
jgi:polygalacturonase